MKKIILSCSFLLASASSAFAQSSITITQPGMVKFTNIGSLISNVISLIMIVAAIATFVYLVWGGLEWITSGGDKQGTESAKNKITSAFIGLFIVFAAWAIVKLLEQFFGICILNCPLSIPTPS